MVESEVGQSSVTDQCNTEEEWSGPVVIVCSTDLMEEVTFSSSDVVRA